MHRLTQLSMAGVIALFGAGCSRTEKPSGKPASDPTAMQKNRPNESRPAVPGRTPQSEERQTAVLAGGCFWGMEDLLRKLPGVIETTVGYTGGKVDNPGYRDVSSGRSGHAESVRVVFDPKKLSYERLLFYFFSIHDPTTKNRQGNDVGAQYRSAIFVENDSQRRIAEKVIAKVNASGDWDAPVRTEVADASPFYPAESYHQDYLQKNPGGYTCHFERDVSYY